MASCVRLRSIAVSCLAEMRKKPALLVLHEQVLGMGAGHLLLDRFRFGHGEDRLVLHGLGRDAERRQAIQEFLRGQMGQG